MRKTFIRVLLLSLVVSVGIVNGQEKYAVLITGDYAATGVPAEQQWGGGDASDSIPFGKLLQNVPNPFNKQTQIWYKIQDESVVEIKIYNYTGQVIKSISEGNKTKGTYHIDLSSSSIPAGMYLYTISINGKITDSKKMTIIK